MADRLSSEFDNAVASERHPGERVWSLEKDGSEISATVTFGPYGWELRLFLDHQFRYSHRQESRRLAIDDAISCRQQFETAGWSSRPPIDATASRALSPLSSAAERASADRLLCLTRDPR